jgi:predicted extracellular nuclease
MNMHAATKTPAGRLTILAALLAGLSAPAFAASDVVISQLYGGGGSGTSVWNRDFVELFNRSSGPVSLKGLSLQYQSATGTTWQAGALPDVTLAPGQYFLVASNPGTTGANIDNVNHIWGAALSATTGKVALSSMATKMNTAAGEAILDLVGFGGADRFEGTVAPAPSVVNSLHRAALGCTDTDNNGSDFSAAPVATPRHKDSPLNVCGGGGGTAAQKIVPVCPASLQAQQGAGAFAALSASDADSIVNSASIASGAVAGIELRNFVAASSKGGSASGTLNVDASVPAGSYPLTISFGNDDGQDASCTVDVRVAGQLSIQGVVTALVGSGYFLQDADGDFDPATSDAIFVFGSSAGLAVGDLVKITGTVTEYTPSGATRSYTEFKDVGPVTKLGSGISIAPTNVEMPSDLARVEGMLVRFTTPLTVNGNAYLGERGELTLSYGRREIPTNRYVPGSAEARALASANAANIIVLDDGIFTTPATIPYLFADGTVRAGDTVTDLTGVVDFGAIGGGGAAFKLQPTVTPTFSRTNERIASPVVAAGNVKVASANVLNFFTTFTNGTDAWGGTGKGCTIGSTTRASNCRGADNMAEFVRQRDKIVASLSAINADVVGLMEIQNNGDIAVGYLVDQLNAKMGAPAPMPSSRNRPQPAPMRSAWR